LSLSPELLSSFNRAEQNLINHYGDKLNSPRLLAKIAALQAGLPPAETDAPKPQRTSRLPAPPGSVVAAVCFICKQEFTAINLYNAHRNMELSAEFRVCLPMDEARLALRALTTRKRREF